MNQKPSFAAPESVDMQSPERDPHLTPVNKFTQAYETHGSNCGTFGLLGSTSVPLTAELERAGRYLAAVQQERKVSDAEILQHARDCARLMERAYRAFDLTGNQLHRQRAIEWMRLRDEARNSLSPAWRAAREAQIAQSIEQGTGCYFLDSADKARAELERR